MQKRMEEIKGRLAELKSAVESADEAAITETEALVAEAEELEGKMERAAKAASAIANMGAKSVENTEEPEPKSLGEMAAKHFVGKAVKGQRFDLMTPEVKSVATITKPTIYSYDTNIAEAKKRLGIADLFSRQTISGNNYVFWRQTDKEGTITTVAEDGQKPQIDFTETQVVVPLTKVACIIKESDELMEDAAWMASAIENRGVMNLLRVEETQLLSGNGTAPNMTGVLSTSGIGSVTYAHGGSLAIGDVLKAKTKVMTDSGYAADAVVINPADFDSLITASLSAQYAVDPWGYGDYRLWGMQVVQSDLISQGTVLVGAFREGATIVEKGGVRVEASNSDSTDFQYNRIAIRIEKREALAVRVPAAFVAITEAAS